MSRKKGTKNDKGTLLVIKFPRWERDTHVSSDDSYEEDFVYEEHPADRIRYGKWSKYQCQDVVPVNAFTDVYDMELESMFDYSESDMTAPEDIKVKNIRFLTQWWSNGTLLKRLYLSTNMGNNNQYVRETYAQKQNKKTKKYCYFLVFLVMMLFKN